MKRKQKESPKDYPPLDCMDCGRLSFPYRVSPNGSVSYRCFNEAAHGDSRIHYWTITESGDIAGCS